MFRELTHHAYVVAGDPEDIISLIETSLLENIGFNPMGNPDYFKIVRDHASVDDVAALQIFQENKPIRDKKIVVFGFDRITVEAQNKLLKTLEEPRGETHIILVTANTHILLPTVTSRLEFISVSHKEGNIDGRAFLEASEAERLKLIDPYLESRKQARSLLNAIEHVLQEEDAVKKESGVLHTFFTVRGYLADRGSSVKQLLEYLAVSLPRIQRKSRK